MSRRLQDFSDGVQAAVVHRWDAVCDGDEFSYTGPPDPAKWKAYSSAAIPATESAVPGWETR